MIQPLISDKRLFTEWKVAYQIEVVDFCVDFHRSVADNLKQGKFVQPQNYNESTVYFSDIVGFLDLTTESNPMQVREENMSLLQSLHTDSCYDNAHAYFFMTY